MVCQVRSRYATLLICFLLIGACCPSFAQTAPGQKKNIKSSGGNSPGTKAPAPAATDTKTTTVTTTTTDTNTSTTTSTSGGKGGAANTGKPAGTSKKPQPAATNKPKGGTPVKQKPAAGSGTGKPPTPPKPTVKAPSPSLQTVYQQSEVAFDKILGATADATKADAQLPAATLAATNLKPIQTSFQDAAKKLKTRAGARLAYLAIQAPVSQADMCGVVWLRARPALADPAFQKQIDTLKSTIAAEKTYEKTLKTVTAAQTKLLASAGTLQTTMTAAEAYYSSKTGLEACFEQILADATKACSDANIQRDQKLALKSVPVFKSASAVTDADASAVNLELESDLAKYVSLFEDTYLPCESLAVSLGYKIGGETPTQPTPVQAFYTAYSGLGAALDQDLPGAVASPNPHLFDAIQILAAYSKAVASKVTDDSPATGQSSVSFDLTFQNGAKTAVGIKTVITNLRTLVNDLGIAQRYAKGSDLCAELVSQADQNSRYILGITTSDPLAPTNMRHYVSDQVRLFYFNNIPRLMSSLSRDVVSINPSGKPLDDQLKTASATFQKSNLDTFSALAKVSEDRNQIAILSGQATQLDQQIAAANARVRRLQRKADIAAVQANLASANADNVGQPYTDAKADVVTYRAAVQADNTRLTNDLIAAGAPPPPPAQAAGTTTTGSASSTTAPPPNPPVNLQTSQVQADQAILNRDNALLRDAEQRVKRYANRAELAAAQSVAAQKVQDEAEAAVALAQKDLQALEDKLADNEKALSSAEAARSADNDALLSARIQSEITSTSELQAFAAARDNAPFLASFVSPVASDAARRVIVFGYPDNNTLFLRGLPNDVQVVKEMIANFDRPVPQAKITLHTLQVNGSDGAKMSDVMSNIETELRDYRNINALLQDLLRNAVIKEVNRCAGVASAIYLRKGITLPDRLYRYYYYPREVRKRLGFSLDIDPQDERLMAISRGLDSAVESALQLTVKSPSPQSSLPVTIGTVYDQLSNALLELESYRATAKDRGDETRYANTENLRSLLRATVALLMPFASGDVTTPNPGFTDLDYCVYEASHDDQRQLSTAAKAPIAVAKGHEWRNELASNYNDLVATLKADPMQHKLDQAAVYYDKSNTTTPKTIYYEVAQFLKAYAKDIALQIPSTQSPSIGQIQSTQYVTEFTLPDPVHGTTLGEMLFVISLGEKESRQRVFEDFLRAAQQRITELQVNAGSDQKKLANKSAGVGDRPRIGMPAALTEFARNLLPKIHPEVEVQPRPSLFGGEVAGLYPALPEALLGAERTSDGTESAQEELGSNQLEVLLAMETKARSNVVSEIRYLCRRIDQEVSLNRGLTDSNAAFLRAQYVPLVGWLSDHVITGTPGAPLGLEFKGDKAAADASGDRLSSEPLKKLTTTNADFTVRTDDFTMAGLKFLLQKSMSDSVSGTKSTDAFLEQAVSGNAGNALRMDRMAWDLATVVGSRNDLIHATPRVAAADDMIKRMIIVVENDMDHYFTQPTIETIRTDATQSKQIKFGSFQTESILASNRLIARVDPSATGNIATGGGTDLAAEAAQFSQLLSDVGPKAQALPPTTGAQGSSFGQDFARSATTFALGAAATQQATSVHLSAPLAIGGLLGILDFMGRQSAAHPTQLYSLQSGNTFQITPIFDPSGQALRFKFDFDAATLLQEPTGAASAIPRVDHHRVDTEVQLTNLEMREISSFEVNSRIGTPRIKSGGLPLLRDLPILKEIPLIGFYYEEPKTEPLRQHSLIFAQTSIYPTVSDIVDLLIESSVREDLSQDQPDYLIGKKSH